ncbi:MAG: hypothetical protein ACOCP8_04910 [archaeon]
MNLALEHLKEILDKINRNLEERQNQDMQENFHITHLLEQKKKILKQIRLLQDDEN